MSDQRDVTPVQGHEDVQPGDRFVSVFPPLIGLAVEVEYWLDAERVAVRRPSGARQSFPISTLLNPRYWQRSQTGLRETPMTQPPFCCEAGMRAHPGPCPWHAAPTPR